MGLLLFEEKEDYLKIFVKMAELEGLKIIAMTNSNKVNQTDNDTEIFFRDFEKSPLYKKSLDNPSLSRLQEVQIANKLK